VLLGAKWGDSGQLFTIFAPGIGFMLLYFTHVWIHLSLGRPDRWLRWGFVDLAATTIFLLIGLHWKAQGIAAAWVVSYWVLALPALWYASKPIGLGISEVVGVIWQYVVAALVSGASGYLLIKAIPALRMKPGLAGAITHLSEVSVLFLVFYLLGVIVLHRGLAPIYQVMSLVREMTARVGREPSPGEKAADWRMEDRGRQGWPSDAAAPLVSILIPAYNAREWIGDTLRSALAQTWPNIEIIVVDDGSTDDTAAVAQEFEGQCVKVVTQKNQGAAAARNTAYSQCHGDYIQWLDADDLLAPDKIERQMEVLGPNGSKSLLLSGAWGKFMYRFRHAKFDPTGLWCDLAPAEWLHRKLEQNIYMQTATWLVSRELTEAAGPWDPRLLGDDDGEYFCRVLMASEGTWFVRASQVYYRSFGYDSLGYVGLSMRKCEAHWLSMQLHIKYLRSLEDTPRSRAACMQYLRNCLIYFYPEKSAIVEQTEAIARELGDRLGEPILSWKYVWLKDLFGWEFAKEVQVAMRKVRWRVARKLDGMLFKTEMLQEQPEQTVRRVRMQRDRVPI
jgi:glycosyltransferase involved in cell wall biosynthesis